MAREVEKRSFKYTKRSKENVKERANMRGGNFDSFIKPKFKMYKPRDGKNLIRILPPTWDDANHYGYDLWVNYGIGVDNQSYLSLSKMKNEKDPLAEARREAERDGDKDLSKALQPRQRIAIWVIDRMAEDEGPQLWPAPFSFDRDLAGLSMDEDTKEVMFIDDPEKGNDVRFYKEGAMLKTKYDPIKIKIQKTSPIHDDEGLQDEWLEYINDNPIPECLQFYDYDHIATIFDGQARVEKDDDADEKPKGSRRRPTREEEAEDEEKAETRPLSRSRRGTEPEEEPEVDPEPPRRRRVAEADPEEEAEPEAQPTRRRITAATNGDATPTPRRRAVVDEAEEEPAPEKPSLRDRLRQRRTATADEE